MATSLVFYSWQSDLPNPTNRSLIEEALKGAARVIRRDDSITVEPVVDRDTQGVPGSPDISATILAKIDACDIFVADVSIINGIADKRPTPNPNVLIELGYALKRLGWERIILVCNQAFGGPELLPFDLRQKRVTTYTASEDPSKAEARGDLKKRLEAALRTIYDQDPPISPAAVPVELLPSPAAVPVEPLPTFGDLRWYRKQQSDARPLLLQSSPHGSMEVLAVLARPRTESSGVVLRDAARQAQDRHSGWPIGIILNGQEPSPRNDGITYTITKDLGGSDRSYDYWYLRNDGTFYLLTTLTEDGGSAPGKELWFNLRIKRTAELLLYLFRLYQKLSVPSDTNVHVSLSLQGLQGRHLTATPRYDLFRSYATSDEDTSTTVLDTTVGKLDSKLVDHVIHLTAPLLSLFNFFQVPDDDYERFVQEVRQGKW